MRLSDGMRIIIGKVHRGFTLLELLISIALVTILLVILLPALTSARQSSYREQCADNERRLAQAWQMYLDDHAGEFPYEPLRTGWLYGGVRFSAIDDEAFLDMQRPLSGYTPSAPGDKDPEHLFCCPADGGITGDLAHLGTGRRTAFRAFGTSYRANARLLDAQMNGLDREHRGLRLTEIMTVPSRQLVMGDPIWYEQREDTDRHADWHGEEGKANLLFLDGSVRYQQILPRPQVGPAVVEPKIARRAPEGG